MPYHHQWWGTDAQDRYCLTDNFENWVDLFKSNLPTVSHCIHPDNYMGRETLEASLGIHTQKTVITISIVWKNWLKKILPNLLFTFLCTNNCSLDVLKINLKSVCPKLDPSSEKTDSISWTSDDKIYCLYKIKNIKWLNPKMPGCFNSSLSMCVTVL